MTEQQEIYCRIINNIHFLKNKLDLKEMSTGATNRRFNRIIEDFENLGLRYINPIGEEYNMTRIDCEASYTGENEENLIIQEVIKPIIYSLGPTTDNLLQKGVVIVN